MKVANFLKRSWLGPWLVAVLCVLLLTLTTPRKAEATAVEYAVMLALIIVVVITSDDQSNQNAWGVVGGHLKAAATDAAAANSAGDQPGEISNLSEAIGAAKAMMGLTSSCDNCDAVRTGLQEIIGLAELLKSRALGMASTCNPDGIIEPGEQCDPLAMPTGCPATIFPTFCSDQCLCEAVIP